MNRFDRTSGAGPRPDAREREVGAAPDAGGLAVKPSRIVVENVRPRVDAGEHPVKRTVGETLEVLADVFVDGHDTLAVVLRHRELARTGSVADWNETPMEPLGNDLWRASFALERLGFYEYAVLAWVDRFSSWRAELDKKVAAGQDVSSELLEGAELVRRTVARADTTSDPHPAPGAREPRGSEAALRTGNAALLAGTAAVLGGTAPQEQRVRAALTRELADAMAALAERIDAIESPLFKVWVDRERARCGAWYEMFPRSAGSDPRRSATFREAEARLPAIAAMGFDVLYLPPIHPIGTTHRKGPNNALVARPGDPGSPWAIGGAAGGHSAVDPALGMLADFEHFRRTAATVGLEVALDVAFQSSPDHPWVREHPEWFRHRPDGTIKHAENPPKKYEDIYPFDLEGPAWRELWQALRDVFVFWVERGVRIFRVDNPHTKPLRFWRWLIAEVQRAHPDVIFLAEAFTRPKIMKYLAKVGFTQSYTYFTWRNTKAELVEYFTELTQTDVREYLRPNLFANTPDILHEFLQTGGRAAFQIRLVLAATLGASYGIYGPAFELCEARAIPGTEEYRDSEKYQVRAWDYDQPGDIRDLIVRVNAARRAHPALQFDHRLRFHEAGDDRLLFYSKTTADLADVIFVIVNLDPRSVAEGWVRVPIAELGIDGDEEYQVHDLLSDARYLWHGERNYVRLDPAALPAHLFVVRRTAKGREDARV